MYSWFLVVIALVTVAIALWALWSIQQTQNRIATTEAEMRDKEAIVGALADELVMASQYLYEAMDNCLQKIEHFQAGEAPPLAGTASADGPAQQQPEGHAVHSAQAATPPTASNPETQISGEGAAPHADVTPMEDISTHCLAEEEDSYESHFQALALAAEGIEPVDIARRTGIGIEELRLLMRFQEEMAA